MSDRLREILLADRGCSETARSCVDLTMALYAGDVSAALEVLDQAPQDSPVGYLDELIAPAMHDIGMLWERSAITIADEHLATNAAHEVAATVAARGQSERSRAGATVLLAAPESEQHTLGLMMAARVLRSLGHKAIYLGGGVPADTFRAAVLRHRPDVVALSATMPCAGKLEKMVAGALSEEPALSVLIGGRAADEFSLPSGDSAIAQQLQRAEGLGDLQRLMGTV